MPHVGFMIPIILLIFCGWVAARTTFTPRAVFRWMIFFISKVGFPLLFFYSTSTVHIHFSAHLRFITVLVIVLLICAGLAIWMGQCLFKSQKMEKIFQALLVTYPNIGGVGIPILFPVLGQQIFPPIAVCIVLYFVIQIAVAIFLIERSKPIKSQIVNQLAKTLLNPILLGPLIGITFSSLGGRLPTELDSTLKYIGLTASYFALFTLGVALYSKQKIPFKEVVSFSVIRMLISPTFALIGFYALGVTGIWAIVGVLVCALPQGVFINILSMQYQCYERCVASTIVISTLTALILCPLFLHLSIAMF